MFNTDINTRIRIAIGFIVFFALLSNLRLLLDSTKFDLSQVGHDEITQYQKRFDPIREMLPERGIVGYSGGGLNYAEYWTSDAMALRNWFLTQYTLAPVVVSITPNHRLTIINGSAGGSTDSANDGLSVRDLGDRMKLFDFGNGLRLLISE